MKTVFVLLMAGSSALGQTDLYSNGDPGNASNPGLATGTTSASGVTAPPGYSWSECGSDASGADAVAGFSAHLTSEGGAFRFADDFTVSALGWRLSRLSVFAYQVGAITPPFSAINVRVWSGPPGEPGSVVIHGDATTNVLLGSSATNLYRIFRSNASPAAQPPGTQRPVWRTEADLGGVLLPPGTYWVDWQYVGGLSMGEAFTPPVTLVGQRGKAGSNAMQFRPAAAPALGVWASVVDFGKPSSAADVAQDMPFILNGSCPADLNLDGVIDFNDYLEFLNRYNGEDPRVDFNFDGVIDFNDYLEFLNLFYSAC